MGEDHIRASDCFPNKLPAGDLKSEPATIDRWCADVRRILMAHAKAKPEAVLAACLERGLTAEESEIQLRLMQEGAFQISPKDASLQASP